MPPLTTRDTLYLDDLKVGDRYTSGELTVDEAEIRAFAAQFDPQPFHLDDAYARGTLFGGLAASGWHTAALTMRLLIGGGLPIGGGVIAAGVTVQWPKPTRAGYVLHVESEIIEIRPSRSRPDRGTVTARSTTMTRQGEVVQIMEAKMIVFRRPPAAPV